MLIIPFVMVMGHHPWFIHFQVDPLGIVKRLNTSESFRLSYSRQEEIGKSKDKKPNARCIHIIIISNNVLLHFEWLSM